MQQIFSFIQSHLSWDREVILMTVIGREGSSPGKQGFKMAVASDSSFIGSVGGGVMEHRLVEQCKRLLKKKEPQQPFLSFQEHDPEAKVNRSGMICSGGQTVAFIPLNKNDLATVNVIIDAEKQQQRGVVRFSEKGLSFMSGVQMQVPSKGKIISENQWEYMEQTGLPNTVYIFGGGHVGLALSKIFRNLNFKIHLFDNRSELNTFEENSFADEKQIVNYNNVASLVPEGFNVYVVIVTFAHKSDEQVLEQMLGKNIKYLGLMGSAKKIETIFRQLKQKGVTEEQLKKIHAPIGYPINSETPAEIAVSIAAQVVAVKNGVK